MVIVGGGGGGMLFRIFFKFLLLVFLFGVFKLGKGKKFVISVISLEDYCLLIFGEMLFRNLGIFSFYLYLVLF